MLALALALVVAMPLGLWLGHRGTGGFLAVAIGNAGRGIPELALIALMAAVIGVGVLNVTIALSILGIPPILTNAFVGIRQADRASVDAARGIGMTELEILTRVEMPLAIPTLMAGVRRRDDRDRGDGDDRAAGRGRSPSATTSSTKTSTARTGCWPGRSSSRCWRLRSSSGSPACNVCSLREA